MAKKKQAKEQAKADIKGLATQFKKGTSGNPKGRPKGQRNFATVYRIALEKIAEKKGLSEDDIEVAMAVKAIERALKGDHKFYQDTQDRIHGKAIQTNLNKNIDDEEIDEDEMATLDAMLAKFVKVKPKPKKKAAKKKPVVIKSKNK